MEGEKKKKNTGGAPGKSGPKTLGGTPRCKVKYNCIVPGCEKSFRSDHFSEHYESKSDLVILDEARKMNNVVLGTEHIKGLILDASKRDHTTFLLQNDYSSENLPTYLSKGFKEQTKSKTYHPAFTAFLPKPSKIAKKPEMSDVSETTKASSSEIETIEKESVDIESDGSMSETNDGVIS